MLDPLYSAFDEDHHRERREIGEKGGMGTDSRFLNAEPCVPPELEQVLWEGR